MKVVWTIFKRELKAYFYSPLAYIYICTFTILSNWLFFKHFFIFEEASMRSFFTPMPWIFLFLIPAVSMRLWAEEKKLGTLELFLTLPLKDHEVVAGKFLASFAFLFIGLFLTFPVVITLFSLGSPDIGIMIGGYAGTCFMGGAYLAIGLFVSNLTDNQVIAFIISIGISFIFFLIGEPFVTMTLPESIVPVCQYLGLGYHYTNITRGIIDTRDLIYYITVIFFFLYLNMKSLESRKWD